MTSITAKGKRGRDLKIGERYVHRGDIHRIHVSAGHRVLIYEGPNEGAKVGAPRFLAGEYREAWRNAPRGARAMRDGRPKLIIVEKTAFQPNELLELSWMDGGRVRTVQRLEPGEWCSRGDKHFRNDQIEKIKLPKNAKVSVYDHWDFGGGRITLARPSEYNLDDYGLSHKVSGIRYELDGWVQDGPVELGEVLSKREDGDPIVATAKLRGVPGTSVERYIDIGESEEESTNWHLSQSITASVEIESGFAGNTVKTTFAATTEAGGGGDKSSAHSLNTGVQATIVIPDAPDEHKGDLHWQGTIEVEVLSRRYRVEQEIFRPLKNKRTGDIVRQKGTVNAKRFESDVTSRWID